MSTVAIDEGLRSDCYHLGALNSGALLLNRNALLPWFIVVPDTALNDLLDLPPEQRDSVIADCAAISAFIKNALAFEKVNFAGLGNVVAQMHLHIIGRREGDACWPNPVWGNLPQPGSANDQYTIDQLLEMQAKLASTVGLVPVQLEH